MLEDFFRELDRGLTVLLDTSDLSAHERDVLEARWMHEGEATLLTDVAKARKVTRERVRQIEMKAFQKIRNQARQTTTLADLGRQADQLQHELEALKAWLELLEALRWKRHPEAITPPGDKA